MLATAAILGTGAVAVGAASAVTAGAGAYFYKRKQKRKEKKKKAQKEQIVFGQHLEEITNLSENDLPIVFDFTVSWLENNGLAVDSLFVTTRNPMRAGELARMFDSQSDEEPTFDGEDPRDVSLLLVRYLTDLPEPLCTFVLYDDFVQIEQESNVEEWIEAMRSELLQLPDINLRVIKRLLSFLQLYASEQQRVCSVPTERTIDSLSKIFGRILFNTWDTDSSAFEDQKIAENLFTKLIINYERVFGSSHPMFSPLAQESKVQSISTNNFISLEKEPTTEKSSSPRGTPEKRKKEKRTKKKKRSSQQDKSDMDDMSSPDLGAMCGEAQSEVGISLDKKPLPQIPR